MLESKPRILIISSADPTFGPGVLSLDYYRAFKSHGFAVDLLTLYRCDSYPELLYVYERPNRYKLYLKKVWKRLFNKIKTVFGKRSDNTHLGGSYYFFYKQEQNPPVPIDKVLKVVTKPYDIVQIIFWQEMLSFATVQALYRKLHSFFYFGCVDYSPMSGGCHFIGNCERYKVGCGCCPAFGSNDPHDFTWQNVNFRKTVYDEIDPVLTGNSYMFKIYDQSVLLKDRKRIMSTAIIDFSIFKPYPKDEVRKKYDISKNKTFVLLFGCQNINDERKGVKYLIDGFRKFMDRISPNDRDKILVVAIGNDFGKIRTEFGDIDTMNLGYVSKEQLPIAYSLADVFLCSSVNDPGPTMVNQALCCGTPVVGFEMGACLDSVKGKGTGYCARLKDTDDYADGIESIFHLTPDEKQKLADRCVEFAHATYSYDAAVTRVMDAYHKYKKNDTTSFEDNK